LPFLAIDMKKYKYKQTYIQVLSYKNMGYEIFGVNDEYPDGISTFLKRS